MTPISASYSNTRSLRRHPLHLSAILVIPRTNTSSPFFSLMSSLPLSVYKPCSGLGWSKASNALRRETEQPPLQREGDKLGVKRWKMALPAIVWGFLPDCFWYILAYHTKAWKQGNMLTDDCNPDLGASTRLLSPPQGCGDIKN